VTTYGPEDARCVVLTFREGLLSGIAHDLLLRVTRLEVAVETAPLRVSAQLDATSLRVLAAMHEGRPVPDDLRAADKAEIEATIRNVVLRADRHPEIRFESTAVEERPDGWDVAGRLSIAGATREVRLPVKREPDRLVTELRLHQPDFGIRPYRAMMGALRVSADVVVRASIPAREIAR
jgi:YceI-like protein